MAPWRPQAKTLVRLDQVQAVLDEYAEHLPLTCRQVFYRLVGAYGYPKTEQAYDRLTNMLVRARRAGLIPFDALRDDGATHVDQAGYVNAAHFLRSVRGAAQSYRRDRQDRQPVVLELWCEAAGMAPQLARMVEHYGIDVYSSSGFDSLTVKHDAAQRFVQRDRRTVVLHVGDHDPSGRALFDSVASDVALLALGLDLPEWLVPEFVEVAVTPAQVERYALPSSPAKATDRRGGWEGGTVQAEALAPDQLAAEVRQAVETRFDLYQLAKVLDTEEAERAYLVAELDRLASGEVSGAP